MATIDVCCRPIYVLLCKLQPADADGSPRGFITPPPLPLPTLLCTANCRVSIQSVYELSDSSDRISPVGKYLTARG